MANLDLYSQFQSADTTERRHNRLRSENKLLVENRCIEMVASSSAESVCVSGQPLSYRDSHSAELVKVTPVHGKTRIAATDYFHHQSVSLFDSIN